MQLSLSPLAIAVDSIRHQLRENELLAQLSTPAREELTQIAEQIDLSSGELLFDWDDPLRAVYFPLTATLSIQSLLNDGSSIEVGMIGAEGVAGLPVLLGCAHSANRVAVQMPGTVIK